MDAIRITDVAPRDGLQSEPAIIPASEKIRLVELLAQTRVDEIEVSSFVSPKWIPQLADAAEVFAGVALFKPPGMIYSALIPNEKGMQAALDLNQRLGSRVIDKVSVFTAASETFSKRNTNATIAETIERFRPVIAAAKQAGLLTRGYVSSAIACPFEGPIAPDQVASVVRQLRELDIDEIDVADTIGVAEPATITAMLDAVLREIEAPRVTLHLHDTFGRAAVCVESALGIGILSFDGAVGGLGGCPYASTPERRAPGNVDTWVIVQTARRLGYEVRVEESRLIEAGNFAKRLRGR